MKAHLSPFWVFYWPKGVSRTQDNQLTKELKAAGKLDARRRFRKSSKAAAVAQVYHVCQAC